LEGTQILYSEYFMTLYTHKLFNHQDGELQPCRDLVLELYILQTAACISAIGP